MVSRRKTMKKKVLSEEALALMLNADSALAESQELETNAEGTAEGTEVESNAEGATEIPKVESNEGSEEEEINPLAEELDKLKLESEETIKNLQEEVETLKSASEEIETNAKELKDIVVDQISKMRLALKVAAVDMSSWDAKAVVIEYSSVSESFMKALPVGSVVPTKTKENKVESPVRTSLDASNIKSLGF